MLKECHQTRGIRSAYITRRHLHPLAKFLVCNAKAINKKLLTFHQHKNYINKLRTMEEHYIEINFYCFDIRFQKENYYMIIFGVPTWFKEYYDSEAQHRVINLFRS